MEEFLTDYKECEPIHLEPFTHQVGGHSCILCLDERTVCKPLIKQELNFYETLPNSMKKFTPEYRGVVQVKFVEDPDGYLTVVAYPQKSFRYQVAGNKKRSKRKRFRLKNSGSIEIEIESELSDLFVDEDATSSDARHTKKPNPYNPWALQCHQNQLSKLRRSCGSGITHSTKENEKPLGQKFLVLENLTHRFEYPCVLDLKMGTRQYGDDATPAKIKSQSAKAASTTSGQLGVRVCGMQAYQVTSGKFMCKNKYYGRKLPVEGFKEALYQFLHNGVRLRTDTLPPLIEKLQELKSVLCTLDSFRFYTSSLLLIYEGLDPEMNVEEELPLPASEVLSHHSNGPTGGALEPKENTLTSARKRKGVFQCSKSADNVLRSTKMGTGQEGQTFTSEEMIKPATTSTTGIAQTSELGKSDDLERPLSTFNSSSTLTTSSSSSSNASSNGSSLGLCPNGSSLAAGCVDVRMIDFAHALHSEMDFGRLKPKEHPGSDSGFIFGLSNLIDVLQEIKDENMKSKC